MKSIRVSAAVIKENNKILATQRGYGEFKNKWEFPGGKREEGENGEETIKREIKEELDLVIEVIEPIITVDYDYPSFHITMDLYLCTVKEGTLDLKEHEGLTWLDKQNLYSLDWLEADKLALRKIIQKAFKTN